MSIIQHTITIRQFFLHPIKVWQGLQNCPTAEEAAAKFQVTELRWCVRGLIATYALLLATFFAALAALGPGGVGRLLDLTPGLGLVLLPPISWLAFRVLHAFFYCLCIKFILSWFSEKPETGWINLLVVYTYAYNFLAYASVALTGCFFSLGMGLLCRSTVVASAILACTTCAEMIVWLSSKVIQWRIMRRTITQFNLPSIVLLDIVASYSLSILLIPALYTILFVIGLMLR